MIVIQSIFLGLNLVWGALYLNSLLHKIKFMSGRAQINQSNWGLGIKLRIKLRTSIILGEHPEIPLTLRLTEEMHDNCYTNERPRSNRNSINRMTYNFKNEVEKELDEKFTGCGVEYYLGPSRQIQRISF